MRMKVSPCFKASAQCGLVFFCIGAPGKCGRVPLPNEESSNDEGLN